MRFLRSTVERIRIPVSRAAPALARTAPALTGARLDRVDRTGAADRRWRGRRSGRVSLPDPRLHLRVHRPPRLQRRRARSEPARSRARNLVRGPRARGRRPDLRSARRAFRPGGARSRRTRGDARGQPGRRADPAAGARCQIARVGALHRLGWLGRARGADRADRLGAGLGDRASRPGVRVPAATARGLRRRRRYLGHLQRADRRRVLRARADPAQLRDAVVRLGRAELGDGRRDRAGRVRRPCVPVTCRPSPSARRSSSCSTRGLGVLATVVGVGFVRVLYGGEDLADRVWRGPEWLRPGVGGILLGLLLLAVPQMYGVGYPVLERAVGGPLLLPALLGLLAAKTAGHQPDHVDRRIGRRVRPVAVHGGDARWRLRDGVPPSPAGLAATQAPTRWWGWARCSRPVPGRRSPP